MNNKLNILYIEDTIGLGGSLVSLCLLLQHLNRDNFNPYSILYHENQEQYLKDRCKDVEAFVAKPRESLKTSLPGALLIKCASLLGEKGKRAGFFFIFVVDFFVHIIPYALKIYSTICKRKIHLVHLNTGVCIPGIVLARLLRVPCIATQRGPEWRSPIIGFFSKYITFFMANSEATKRGLIDMGVRPSKISVVYPPVDLEKFDFTIDADDKRKEFDINSDSYSFGILGNVGEEKGHKVVLKAAANVLTVFPKCKIFIIGDSPDGRCDFKEELIRFADKLGIRHNIIFTGFRKDIPELIQLLDIVIHASLFPEPFGKVIIEGMAMKKPVIATQGGGTAEIIDDGVDGYLVPPNDHEILAKTILKLLRDKALSEKIGGAALQKVRGRFGIENHTREVEKVYDEILSL